MCGTLLCVAAAVVGIDAGWRPLPEGGVEYLIQIEPHLVERLKAGEPIQSDLPSEVRNVRAYRITVGTERLPRELPAADVSSPVPTHTGARESLVDPFLRKPTIRSVEPGVTADVPPLWPPSADSQAAPGRLSRDPQGKPLGAQPAVHVEPVDSDRQGQSGSPSDEQPNAASPQQPSRPWNLLIGVALALGGSLGANIYMFWMVRDAHQKYRVLSRQLPETTTQ